MYGVRERYFNMIILRECVFERVHTFFNQKILKILLQNQYSSGTILILIKHTLEIL